MGWQLWDTGPAFLARKGTRTAERGRLARGAAVCAHGPSQGPGDGSLRQIGAALRPAQGRRRPSFIVRPGRTLPCLPPSPNPAESSPTHSAVSALHDLCILPPADPCRPSGPSLRALRLGETRVQPPNFPVSAAFFLRTSNPRAPGSCTSAPFHLTWGVLCVCVCVCGSGDKSALHPLSSQPPTILLPARSSSDQTSALCCPRPQVSNSHVGLLWKGPWVPLRPSPAVRPHTAP